MAIVLLLPANTKKISAFGTPPTLTEKWVIENFPKHETLDADRVVHTTFVIELAQKTPAIIIGSGCSLWPMIHHAHQSYPVRFYNADGITHRIAINETYSFVIPPYALYDIALPENRAGDSIFGYGCDASGHTAGIIYASW